MEIGRGIRPTCYLFFGFDEKTSGDHLSESCNCSKTEIITLTDGALIGFG